MIQSSDVRSLESSVSCRVALTCCGGWGWGFREGGRWLQSTGNKLPQVTIYKAGQAIFCRAWEFSQCHSSRQGPCLLSLGRSSRLGLVSFQPRRALGVQGSMDYGCSFHLLLLLAATAGCCHSELQFIVHPSLHLAPFPPPETANSVSLHLSLYLSAISVPVWSF